MVLPDLNLLIHAHNSESPRHEAARNWWESLMNGNSPVGLAWVVILGFVRVTTHRAILNHPLSVKAGCDLARSWLAQPQVVAIDPGSRHAEIVFGLLESVGSGGNLTTDAHLAGLAVEHQAELHGTDADFSRFPGLRWVNPVR
jgi:toxin-antitoxin system PIN domain toxin